MTDRSDIDVIKSTDPKEFQGETEFRKLSPAQKLEWLANAAAFVLSAKKARNNSSS